MVVVVMVIMIMVMARIVRMIVIVGMVVVVVHWKPPADPPAKQLNRLSHLGRADRLGKHGVTR
jgi:hypothetical protein